ncbi:MAG: DUF3822 family protein [Saprospiraceae bacterium]|nr:DUF3822 family protein [Saprospiraceae bacterium]
MSAVCSADTFSYLVADSGQKHFTSRRLHFDQRYHHFDRPLAYLPEVMTSEQLLYEDFRRARFALRGIPFVSCTASTLRHADPRTLLRQSAQVAPSDEVRVDEVAGTDIRIVYACTRSFLDELALFFEDSEICHVITPLIWSALKRSRRERMLMHIVANRGWLEVVIVSDLALRFANHFPWHVPDDILYYTTAVLQEFAVAPDQLDLEVFGAGVTADLHSYLSRQILQASVAPDVHQPAVQDRLFDLLSVARCGL